MSAIRGVLRNGKVELTGPPPADWPEGAEVRLQLVDDYEPEYGIREEDWPTTPEGIAALLARMDEVQPLIRTPEEEEDWKRTQQEDKEWEFANWDKESEKLEDQSR